MKNVKSHAQTLLFLALTFFITQTFAQQTFKTTPASVIGYLEYLPADYDNNSNKYPVVIFLHGLGERGPNSTVKSVLETGISVVTRNGPPKHVKYGHQFPFILISPQLKNNYGDWPSSYVMEVIDHCKNYLRIDEKRIYITGLSLGGGGTWTTAQDYTKLFAAVAPVCGSRNSTSKACSTFASENLPVWAFHGDADPTVPLSRSVNMVNAINSCSPVPNPKAIMTIYPGIKHNSWDKAYATDYSVHNPNLYDWMMSKTNTINAGNRIPVANAGSDIFNSLPVSLITLSGSGTDADGSIVAHSWTRISGPSVTLNNSTSAKATLVNLIEGEYTFRLKVTDNHGNTDSDYVKVTVKAGTANVAPVANAGSDLTVTLPTSSVSIAGTASDADGTIASYAWTKISGGAATLSGANTAKLNATGMVADTYVFRFTVKDDDGATKSDDVTVTVKASVSKTPPVANAGADKIIRLPATSAWLKGTGSDADGTIATYQWKQLSGPAVTLSSANAPAAKLSRFPITSGVCVFRLTVTDNSGLSGYDDIKVTLNYTPVANAGPDITVTLPQTSLIIKGSGTDQDGTIRAYKWQKKSGPAVTMTNATSAALTLTKMQPGTYSFRFSVLDNVGVENVDYMTLIVKEAATGESGKPGETAPVANAGEDKIIRMPATSARLKGIGSDADGTIENYQWKQLSGQKLTLSYGNTAEAKLSRFPATTGTCVFRLMVTDDDGLSDYDDVRVILNYPPVANAGSDITITLPKTSLVIKGSGTDRDGTIQSYKWVKSSGPSVTMTNRTSAALTLTDIQPGVYRFRFSVFDNIGVENVDYITLTVNGAATLASTGISEEESSDLVTDLEEEGTSEESESLIKEASLDTQDDTFWTDKKVVIYNDGGKMIYTGLWSAQTYTEVFQNPGLYIYHILQGSNRLSIGKIYITR